MEAIAIEQMPTCRNGVQRMSAIKDQTPRAAQRAYCCARRDNGGNPDNFAVDLDLERVGFWPYTSGRDFLRALRL